MASLASNSQVSWSLRDREGSPFKQIRSFYVINLLSNFYDGPSYQITAGDTRMFDGCSQCLKSDFGFSGCTLQHGRTTTYLSPVVVSLFQSRDKTRTGWTRGHLCLMYIGNPRCLTNNRCIFSVAFSLSNAGRRRCAIYHHS